MFLTVLRIRLSALCRSLIFIGRRQCAFPDTYDVTSEPYRTVKACFEASLR